MNEQVSISIDCKGSIQGPKEVQKEKVFDLGLAFFNVKTMLRHKILMKFYIQ